MGGIDHCGTRRSDKIFRLLVTSTVVRCLPLPHSLNLISRRLALRFANKCDKPSLHMATLQSSNTPWPISVRSSREIWLSLLDEPPMEKRIGIIGERAGTFSKVQAVRFECFSANGALTVWQKPFGRVQ